MEKRLKNALVRCLINNAKKWGETFASQELRPEMTLSSSVSQGESKNAIPLISVTFQSGSSWDRPICYYEITSFVFEFRILASLKTNFPFESVCGFQTMFSTAPLTKQRETEQLRTKSRSKGPSTADFVTVRYE